MTRILIVAPAWIGDMVMTGSLVSALRRREPEAIIHLLAPHWTAPLGARIGGVAETHAFDAVHGRFDLRKRIATGRDLKAGHFDLAIVLPASFKSAIPSFVAGIPRRRGYLGEMRYGLLNEARRLDKEKLPRTVDRFVALADDAPDTVPEVRPPVLAHDPEAARIIAVKLGLAGEKRPTIGLCPGAEYGPAKQWPASHYAALAGRLAEAGYAVWIFGSDKDKPVGETIVRLAASRDKKAVPANLCGRTGLIEALDLMSLTAGIVSNDSGLMHIGAAIGRPLVAIFGSTSPQMTPPLGDAVRILERELACRPCFKRVCPLGHLDCLNLIGAVEVADALTGLIGPTPKAA